MLQEFKKFIMRGNVVDLAVALIIGAAFGRIITSFVDDVLMPILGIFVGGINFADLKIVIEEAQGEAVELAIYYGNFLQSLVDFLIIGFVIFMMIRLINNMRKKKEEAAASPVPTNEEKLLEEIRDILRAGN